jgi:hypothetical protein
MRSSLVRMRSSLMWMRSSLVVRASDCQCTSCNGPGFDPSIRRHSGIWGAADEAVLNIVWTKRKKSPPKIQKKMLSKKNLFYTWMDIDTWNYKLYIWKAMLSDTISSIFERTSDRKNGIFLKGYCFVGVMSSIFERTSSLFERILHCYLTWWALQDVWKNPVKDELHIWKYTANLTKWALYT